MHCRFIRALPAAVLALILAHAAMPLAQADVVHLHNGKIVRGKIHRVTGDLIEFANNGARGNIQRINLTNRRDVVEMMGKRRFFGEVTYIDKFKVEIWTASGRRYLNRFFVKNVVLGTPAEHPVNDYVESIQQQYERHQFNRPASYTEPMSVEPRLEPQPADDPGIMFPGETDRGY